MTDIAELAAKTAAEIRRRGWCQGDLTNLRTLPTYLVYPTAKEEGFSESGYKTVPAFDDFDGEEYAETLYAEDELPPAPEFVATCKVCAIGAIRAAATGSPLGYAPAVQELELVAKLRVGAWLGTWNDDPDRTEVEVLALFDDIAKEYAA